MRTLIYISILAIVLTNFYACSTTRLVKPLDKKEVAVGFDFGGPLINFSGIKIPLPFTSFTGAYGIDSSFTAYGSLHTTALFAGVLQLEGGVVKDLYKTKGWGFGVMGAGHFMIDFWKGQARFYPEVDLNVHWTYSKKHKHFAYFSMANWFDFWAKQAHGEKNKEHYIPNFALGHTFVTKKMRYTLEVKFLAPFSSNKNLVVGYNGIGGQGTFGFYFSMYRMF